MSPSDQDSKGTTPPQGAETNAGADTATVEPRPAPTQPAPQASALEDISSEAAGATPAAADPPQPGGAADGRGIQMLMDVDLTVTAELGRTRMTIGEVMNLSSGSIITLSKIAGETVDLRVNDKLLASGEVIVVDGHFAVKITKLLSKEERASSLT